MKKLLINTMVTIALLLCGFASIHGQSGFYVPAKGKIFFNGDTATIFSNVTNNGQIGLGKNAVVNFKGKQWENDEAAIITDESNNGNGTSGIGGIIKFLVPDASLSSSINQQQVIVGGYNAAIRAGTSFTNVSLNNPWGVKLVDASAKIRGTLNFQSGHLFLNDNILAVGNNNPGVINGYDENKFIVTGPFANGSGYLLREKLISTDGYVTFPVGTTDKKYAPAAVRTNSNVPDDFIVGLFDGVRSNVATGADLNASSVNKTWHIGKLLRPNEDRIDVILQHRIEEEGSDFKANRQSAYIAQYASNTWDEGNPRSAPQSASLTTGAISNRGATNLRNFSGTMGSNSYFTKLVHPKDTTYPVTNILLRAHRLNDMQVGIYWTTYPEVNIRYFIIQRMLSNETTFSNVGQLASKAGGPGVSQQFDYTSIDANSYKGLSYYRIMLVDYYGNVTYSNVVPVGPQESGFGLTLWPNPSSCKFFVGISGAAPVESIVIFDVVGRKVMQEKVNNRNIIPLSIFKPGAYFVTYVAPGGQYLETKKLIIAGY